MKHYENFFNLKKTHNNEKNNRYRANIYIMKKY